MARESGIDFAYKYPFTEQARDIIKSMNFDKINREHLDGGAVRLQAALASGVLDFKDIGYEKPKVDSIANYIYARMLVSALKNSIFIKRYSDAEAKRSAYALRTDTEQHIMEIAKQTGMVPQMKDGKFLLDFVTFLLFAHPTEENSLVNQGLSGGVVPLDRYGFLLLLESAISKTVEKGLPINQKSIPKEVIERARTIKVPVERRAGITTGKGGVAWIERLLATPIPDCRHRTVNLILAPYMVNVRNMEVEEAVRRISAYIDLCRTANPTTNITERYIKYQCEWAKKHGMRPLSLDRAAKELFSSMDIDLIGNTEVGK